MLLRNLCKAARYGFDRQLCLKYVAEHSAVLVVLLSDIKVMNIFTRVMNVQSRSLELALCK